MRLDKTYFDQKISRLGTDSFKWDVCRRENGRDAIPMFVADMDFPSPPGVQEALLMRAAHPFYGYTEVSEAFNLALCDFWKRHHQVDMIPESILSLPCVVSGLKIAIQALTEPGDGVILQKPVYGPFMESVKLSGRREMNASLIRDAQGRYTMDLEKIETFCREGARLMLLCNPHNPVGRAWTWEEMNGLARILDRYGVPLVSDEIHADFVFHPHVFQSALKLDMEKKMVLCAASKTFNLAGLQMASAVCPGEDMRTRIRKKMEENGVVSGNIFGLTASRAAYETGDEWLSMLKKRLKRNIEWFDDLLSEKVPCIRMTPMEATYLAWLDMRAFGLSTKEIVDRLKGGNIIVSPGTFFGEEGFIRVNLACSDSNLVVTALKLEELFRS